MASSFLGSQKAASKNIVGINVAANSQPCLSQALFLESFKLFYILAGFLTCSFLNAFPF
jgi:hypothetical protein